MNKIIVLSAVTALMLTSGAFAGSSYITGNIQFHDDGRIHGSKITSTDEIGHTFDNRFGGFTVYAEIDGIQLGDYVTHGGGAGQQSAYLTLGGEQAFKVSENFWVGAGYQHLFQAGNSIQARPLIKIGYNFDNGISLSNRTRWHIDQTANNAKTDTRWDNRVGYKVNDYLSVAYNNVYMFEADTMDHEFRLTWTRQGVQPYFEFRSQAHGAENAQGDSLVNNAYVFGASYGF